MLIRTQSKPAAGTPAPETPPARPDFTVAVARFRSEVQRYIGEIDLRIARVGRALVETEAHHRRLRARREALDNRKEHMTRLLTMCGGPAPDDETRRITASAHR